MAWVSYEDITSRIAEKPKWWFRGVPRYCEFSPQATAALIEVALVRAACESCRQEFRVAIEDPGYQWGLNALDLIILNGDLGVAGVPAIGCCGAEHLISAVELELLEFWDGGPFDWTRRTDLEGPLVDDRDNPDRRMGLQEWATRAGMYEEYMRLSKMNEDDEVAELMAEIGHPESELVANVLRKWRQRATPRLDMIS